MLAKAFIAGGSALLIASCAAGGSNSGGNLAADTANLPKTDILLAALAFDGATPALSDMRVAVNMSGYDNQPAFLPGEPAFLFVSEGETGATDIWRYDIGHNVAERIHHSPSVSEYSPQAAPDGLHVSYIQENETREITRVHKAPLSGEAGEAVVDFAPLGYYAWLGDDRTLAVYLRSDPPSLHLVDVESGATREIYRNIGRALHARADGSTLLFTTIGEGGRHVVMRYETVNDSVAEVFALPGDGPDFFPVFDDGGALRGVFSGAGAMIYYKDAAAGVGDDWRAIAEIGENYGSISRIAISSAGDWITIVAAPN